jgi:catechol 2,3-dioxygenase-like lactoylglutathione lyase family enzyme
MLGTKPLVAFGATQDSTRARAFYEQVLGLRIVSEDGHTLVCDANGTVLRIQKVAALQPQPFTMLGWLVPDIASMVEALVQRGVRFERYEGFRQDERGIWVSPSGARVAWFKDPDGNILSLAQM